MKVLSVFGTRPEAIKMAPVIKAFAMDTSINSKICVTGQHRTMLDQVLTIFDIKPDYDLAIMSEGQTLTDITCQVLQKLQPILQDFQPDWILVHGDTTTTFAASLAAYYQKIPTAHLEAGLRTRDIYSPWPEEINRQLAGRVAKLHFAPTHEAKANLLAEAVAPDDIHVSGNTVIDALLQALNYLKENPTISASYAEQFNFLDSNKKLLLVTCHRRENFGAGIEQVCQALLELSKRSDLQIVYPVHLNPNIKEPVYRLLGEQKNIHLIPPLDYLAFVYLMDKSHFILTDSGGIQEEAPSLGKPVLVARDTTERPEAIKAGTARLVGTNKTTIISAVNELLDDANVYLQMAKANNPYGDGRTAYIILERMKHEQYNK